jgi:signal transduction histidine kinase
MPAQRPTAGDVLMTIVLIAGCIMLTVLFRGGPQDGRAFDGLALALVLAGFAPIAIWRSKPLLPALSALTVLLIGGLLEYAFVGPTILTLGLVGLAASRREGRLLSVLSGLTFAIFIAVRADSEPVLSAIGGFAVGIVPALVGEQLRAARERTRRVEQLRDHDVQRAVAEERLRIARDVHDITGHHLSAIALLSAGAGRTTEDATARGAFERIHALTAEALGQTRRALGVLRDDSAPAELAPPPRLEHVEQLLEPARAAGLAVDLRVDGAVRALPEAAELSAYRVVQESLANVMRHAEAASVDVEVRYGAEELTVTVSDDGRAGRPGSPGSGIEGMRERVALVGGTLAAGPRNGRGWSVRATLPLKGER